MFLKIGSKYMIAIVIFHCKSLSYLFRNEVFILFRILMVFISIRSKFNLN